ncbi:MAG TPA: SDR family NAD(P)-dependent oxidoreductase, partial [Polyangiaceae bacterium]|nr:SDR family NAD(P)-dependent oxidoreductase [Polyangiaceae bacterium]
MEPDAVVGHSMGEIAAACFAGVLSLEAAAQLICLRTRLLSRVTGEGAMAVVELSLARAREAIASHPGVFVAVSNSPRSTVLSGNTESLERVLDELTEAGVFCGWGVANVASHTPEMRSLAEELGRGIASLEPKSARLPLYSSVVGGACDGRDLTPAYWVRHLNDTVLFSRAVEALVHDGHTRFLELAPHPVLLPAIEDCLRQAGMAGQVLAALRREEPAATPLLEVLARLYVDGQPITYEMLYPKGRLLPLPAYPWQRERHWVEPAPAAPAKLASLVRLREYGHPLLRTHAFEAAHDAGTRVWELELSTREFAYLNDHRVQETVVLPATVYLELGLAAAQELFGPGSHGLEKFEFITPLVVADGDSRTLQIVVTPSSATRASIRFYAVEAATAETKRAFTLHAQGQLNLEGEWGTAETRGVPPEPDAASTQMPGSDYYSALGAQGLHYGPAFQGIQTLWHRPGEAVGKLRVREGVNAASGYCLHPALADAAFQVLGGVFGLAREAEQRTYLPAGVDQYRVFSALRVHPERELWVRVRLAPDSADGDAAIRADLELLELDGTRVLAVRGLLAKPLDRPRPDPAADWLLETSWQLRALPQVSRAAQAEAVGVAGSVDGAWLLFADRKGVAQAVARKLNARGGRSVLVWPGKAYRSIEPDRFEINPLELADYQRLLKDALPDLPLRGVVCLFHLSTGPQDPARQSDVLEAEALGAPALLQIVQALAKRGLRTPPRLWVVTEDAVPVCGADALSGVLQSPLWGFCRVVAQEHSEFACSRVDLPVPSAGSEPIDAATLALLVDELGAATAEDQIAFRGGERYVARLVRADPAGVQGRSWRKVREQPCRLEIDKPGMLDRLQLVPLEVRRPGPGEVEIRVAFTGLNFLDVLSAMGLRPGHVAGPLPLGFECSGQVVAVGDGVGELKPGDEVVAVAPWAFASHVITRHELVVKRPPGLSLEELATVPGCFMTAYAALVHEGRLQRGETVLIHSAASGTGQAAVQIALARGARVFATAGSEEKRAQLRQLGLAAVMDSRSLEFADEVLALTGGVGVDVVLNSLSGEAMLKSLSIVAPLGRFIEIGKKDVFEDARLALAPFRAGLTYSVLDIAALTEKRPERAGALLEEVVAQAADKTLVPLPRSVFPVSRVSDAFRFMASGRHTGKIVVAFDDENAQVSVPSKPGGRCKPDRTYLVTGGLGGLGLATARWLCEQGARHLVLVGRRAPSQAASQSVAELRAQGVEVTIEQVDVTSKEQTRSLIDRTQANLPPLAGIVHAAGVLDDSTLLQESAERLRTVCAPKLWGAVNICLGSHAASLDFLVLYSSGAALLGSPGQANYSAANSFLDAFAHYLRRRGVPALSINWGPFSDVGLVASPDFRQRFASRGLGTLTARQGMDMLGRLLGAEHAQIGVMPLNLRQWCQSNPKAAKSQVFEVLAAEGASSSAEAEGRTRDVLVGLPSRERADALNAHLRELLSRVLRTPEDRISYDAPF